MKLPAFIPKFGLTGRFIAWFMLVSMVPLILITFLSYNRSRVALEDLSQAEIATIAEAAEDSIIAIVEGEVHQIEALAKNQILHSLEHSDEELEEIKKDLELTLIESDEYYEIFMISPEGKIVASSNTGSIGQDKSSDEYFTEVNTTGKSYIKDIYISPSTREIAYTVSSPIVDPITNENYGVLVGRVKVDNLSELLHSLANSTGETADFFLLNREHLFITTPRFLNDSVLLSEGHDTQHVTECIEGIETEVIENNYRDKEALGAYRSKKILNKLGKEWCVAAEIDKAEADLAAVVLRNMLLGISGLISVTVVLISVFAAFKTSKYIKEPIKDAADLLGRTSISLSAATQQAASASQHNSSIAQEVATGATKQSEQAGKMVEVMSQMAVSIQQMGKSVTVVTQSSENAANLAKEAGQSGEKSKMTLTKMRDVIANSTTMVKEVAAKSQSISVIVKTITEIAEQTNLLSLNASIEAARAGEAGRGFAVVATEVKDLSEEAKASASKIDKLVNDMLANIDETVTASEESNRTVDESTEVIGETLSRLQSITESMLDVSEKIQEVSAVIQQQSGAVENVTKNLGNVNELARQSAAGAQQLSASSQQQSAINQQVAAASQQLLALSTDLQLLVGDKDEDTKTEVTADIPASSQPKLPSTVKQDSAKTALVEEHQSEAKTPIAQPTNKIELKKIGTQPK